MLSQKLKVVRASIDNGKEGLLSFLWNGNLELTIGDVRICVARFSSARIGELARVEDGYLAPAWVEVDRLVVGRLDDQPIIRLYHVHGANGDEVVDLDAAKVVFELDERLLTVDRLD